MSRLFPRKYRENTAKHQHKVVFWPFYDFFTTLEASSESEVCDFRTTLRLWEAISMLFAVCLYITMHKTNAKWGKSIKIYRGNTLRLCIFIKITTFEATFTTFRHDSATLSATTLRLWLTTFATTFRKTFTTLSRLFCDYRLRLLRLSERSIQATWSPQNFRFSRFTVWKWTDSESSHRVNRNRFGA